VIINLISLFFETISLYFLKTPFINSTYPRIIPDWIDSVVLFPIILVGVFSSTGLSNAVEFDKLSEAIFNPGRIDPPIYSLLSVMALNTKHVPISRIIQGFPYNLTAATLSTSLSIPTSSGGLYLLIIGNLCLWFNTKGSFLVNIFEAFDTIWVLFGTTELIIVFVEDASSSLKEALKGDNLDDIKKKTETLVQASMKLGEAIYKSQQNTKPDSNKDDGKDEKGKKDDNVVDADFEEVKDENKEKSA